MKETEKAEQETRHKAMLKRRVPVVCSCGKAKSLKERSKYGVSRCDAYSFSFTVANILANALFQYLADANRAIIRDDWVIIEKHAQAIREFASADSWDELNEKVQVRIDYSQKERAWREAMHWLTENWQGLWW